MDQGEFLGTCCRPASRPTKARPTTRLRWARGRNLSMFASPKPGNVSSITFRRGQMTLFGFESPQSLNRKENRVMLKFGTKVVYPYQGPCLVGAVVKKVIVGRSTSFYHLALLDGSGGELFVPVD